MKDALGARIKRYEQAYNHTLTPRSCLFIRVDGKAFHTYTRKMQKPFDQNLIDVMVYAAQQTIKTMQGVKAAYIQSDECTFMLTDFDELETQGWFNYELNKVVSISAASYTAHFNKAMRDRGVDKIAMFDSRAFIVPYEDTPNVFIWRQRDWQRNSIQMLARAHFSQKTLHGENVAGLKQLLTGNGVDWEALPDQQKNGTFLFAWNDFKPDYRSHDYDGLRQRIEIVTEKE
jgi:tRNA(His) 5'-end guanylyltransferase